MENDAYKNDEEENSTIPEDSNIIRSEEGSQNGSGCAYQCCYPSGTFHRFIALIFMCFLGFGSYFCFDNPSALENKIKEDMNITMTEYNMLYSMYSWPNVILCFIGGYLIDRVFGLRLGSVLYMSFLLIGQAITAAGAYWDIFWLMLAGRFIFGIGGESLAVAQNNYAIVWFRGKELNMVFGLQLSFARLGSTVNFQVMDPLYKWVSGSYTGHECLGLVLFIANLTCVGSLICALVLAAIDKRAERLLNRNENATEEKVNLKDIKDFPAEFWLLSVICVAYYSAIFPFIGLGKDFFIKKFHLEDATANFINGLVYLISAFASPVLGIVVDKTGKNIFWVFLAVAITLLAHTLLGFTELSPYVGMVIMGMSYSLLASSLWPIVSYVIPDHQLGTAYGMAQAIQNLGLAIVPIITGKIIDNSTGDNKYYWVEIFFLLSLAVGILATFALWLLNKKKQGLLNMTPGQRDAYNKAIPEDQQGLLESENDNEVENSVNSDAQIRNRYLSRIGASVPESYNPQ